MHELREKLNFIGIILTFSMLNQAAIAKVNNENKLHEKSLIIKREVPINPIEEMNTAFQIQSNYNYLVKSVKKKDSRSKKTQFELNKNQEDAYNEIMNKIMENQFLAMKIPPSLNSIEIGEDSVTTVTSMRPKDTTISQITTTSLKAEIEAQKLSELSTSETSGRTSFRLFELGGYCEGKYDGLYTDLEDCENFIICYAGRTFRTKCAIGTKWNHWGKECDYADKVDCDRRSTTIPIPTVSTAASTKKSSMFSIFTKKNLQTKPKIFADDINGDITSNIKSNINIVLISILVPIAIIALVVLAVSLWVWNRTFKQQKQQLKSRRKLNQSSNQVSSRFQTDSESEGVTSQPPKKKCPYFCNPILWNKRNSSFKPYIQHMCRKKSERVNSLKSNSEQTSRMTGTVYDDRKTPVTNMIQLTPIDNCCQVATDSHATLSSHFEENNWDYNFATRGLYLTQPWLRGACNQAMTADSYNGSIVLTLDPCNKNTDCESPDIASNNIDALNNNGGYSDTDGYYA